MNFTKYRHDIRTTTGSLAQRNKVITKLRIFTKKKKNESMHYFYENAR
jgi:hypothetical protein